MNKMLSHQISETVVTPTRSFAGFCNSEIYNRSNSVRGCLVFTLHFEDWDEANNVCEAMGARLPVITSKGENDVIQSLAIRVLTCLAFYYFCPQIHSAKD